VLEVFHQVVAGYLLRGGRSATGDALHQAGVVVAGGGAIEAEGLLGAEQGFADVQQLEARIREERLLNKQMAK